MIRARAASLYGTVFMPGATMDYGDYFSGTAEEFRDWVWAAHEAMQVHSHQITNVLVELDSSGGAAVSEAYVTVCLRTRPSGGTVTDIVDRGRYLDRWSKGPDNEWRIAARRFRSDVQQLSDAGSSPSPVAARDPSDPSYELFRAPAGPPKA
ncbi:MAG TPA: nuclear transport factor 2 family protein [Acidimicrobiales bacterium]|nr:nuclear transport factor 2 family protein [Acidimicrobiales bacterium]